MRATVDAKAFSQALDKVSRALNKSNIPILQEVLVRIFEGRCVLTGTNLDTWLTTELPAQGDDLAFVFHRTRDAAKVCRHFDGELVLELTEVNEGRAHESHLRLRMSCGNKVGERDVFFPGLYPDLPELKPTHFFTVDAARLLKRTNRVKYALQKSDCGAKTLSTCIQFDRDRIFCLDGYRAAWDTDDTLTVPVSFMVSAAPLKHLKLFGNLDVSVRVGDRYIDISDGTLHLRFCRGEAEVFNLDCAIPQTFREEITVYPGDFLEELNYLKEVIPATEKPYVRFEDGRLSMQVHGCMYQTTIQMEHHSESIIGFNLYYLLDALQQFKEAPCVKMKLNAPFSPILLEAEGRKDYALVMPVRLKDDMAA